MIQFIQLVIQGISLGSIYALVALGLAMIYRATGVFNFAQGGFVLLGAFLVYNASTTWGLPFALSVVIAVAIAALVGLLIERIMLRRMVGRPTFTTIILTFGLLSVITEVCSVIWGNQPVILRDPWGIKTVSVGSMVLSQISLWTIGLTVAIMILLVVLFQRTKIGLAMRAASVDQEAATAQGIRPALVVSVSWAVGAAVAVIGGTLLSSGGVGVQLANEDIALRAFPALILGGLTSPVGTVLGAYILGVVETLTGRYIDPNVPWLGSSFHTIVSYIVMVIILMLKPRGLLGKREVLRA